MRSAMQDLEELRNQKGANMAEEEIELEYIIQRLKEEGLNPSASVNECLLHLWHLYQHCNGSMQCTMQDLEELRQQQAAEMKEVENYVDHIRKLSEGSEAMIAEYEGENKKLKIKLQQLQLEQEAQIKEVEEMLNQEGLSEIERSSPSEQIAYLLVERATLLEKLEAAERKLDSQSYTGSLRETQLQEELDQMHQTLEDELRQQRESMQHTKEAMNKELLSPSPNPWKKLFGLRKAADSVSSDASGHNEELEKERKLRERLERDLDEAAHRLQMSHEEIRRLTDELDMERKCQDRTDPTLEVAREEIERLREEANKLKNTDLFELQKAKEHNAKLDKEILVLRNRVRSLDSERKALLEQIHGGEMVKWKTLSLTSATQSGSRSLQQENNDEKLHKRCQQEIEEKEARSQEMQYKLQKLIHEHEELIERNEELESILGETQNQTKQERERFECEIEGLHRKVITGYSPGICKPIPDLSSFYHQSFLLPMKRTKAVLYWLYLHCDDVLGLELELIKVKKKHQDSNAEGQELPAELKKEKELQQLLKNSQEKLEILESRLTEEAEWRKQLESDLNSAQSTLRKERQELYQSRVDFDFLRKETETIKAAASERDSLKEEAKRLKEENYLIKCKVSEVEEKCRQLEDSLAEQCHLSKITAESCSAKKITNLTATAKVEHQEQQFQQMEKERCALQNELSEKHVKLEALEKEVDVHKRDKQHLQEEINQLKQKVSYTQQQLKNSQGETEALLQQSINAQTQLLISQSSAGVKVENANQSWETLHQQKEDELKQLQQHLRRVQNLCSSAEKELRYEREKCLDLKKQNMLLQQDSIKLNSDLNSSQSKLSAQDQNIVALKAELEHSKIRLKELELEVVRQTQNAKQLKNGEEKLNAEKSKVIDAEKKVFELQQQLKSTQHQLCLSETQIKVKEQLEEDVQVSKENIACLRVHLHEELLQRKLLEQNVDELQQQIRALHTKEARLSKSNTELQLLLQQQETRLRIMADEKETASDEHLNSQKAKQKLHEQLSTWQQESEGLQEELQNILKQLDSHMRKYNEKQSRHKAKLRRAKDVFVREMNQREMRMKQLENDLTLTKVLAEKEQNWNKLITAENDKLLLEKRELLQKFTEMDEVTRANRQTISTLQQRVHYLEEENQQLQERILRLTTQVGELERALRNMPYFNLEEMKRVCSTEFLLLSGSRLPSPNTSHSQGCNDSGSLVDTNESIPCAQGSPKETRRPMMTSRTDTEGEGSGSNLNVGFGERSTNPVCGGLQKEKGPGKYNSLDAYKNISFSEWLGKSFTVTMQEKEKERTGTINYSYKEKCKLLETELFKYKSLCLENWYLTRCVEQNIVPKGLRLNKYPNNIRGNEKLFKTISDLLNECGISILKVMISSNTEIIEDIKSRIDVLQSDITKDLFFTLQEYKDLYCKVLHDVDVNISKNHKQKLGKIERDLHDYREGKAYTDPGKFYRRKYYNGNGFNGKNGVDRSFPAPGVCDTLGILEVIQRVKSMEPADSLKSSFSTSRSQHSEMGYLNLTSPMAEAGFCNQEEGHSSESEDV
ncbi:coiled-coil domain-containing protein 30 [Protopterus annectens]|uniref:coiled-coil domain-containing protein 30 n=1 Tax=Protopterus annectens TaxID=7888 RepID=UPI001CF984CB|nr:coiled-coil domain-containing protein 30 [Protopterus annectens]